MLRAHLTSIFSPDLLPDPVTGRARRRLPGLPAALPSAAAALSHGQWRSVIDGLPDHDSPACFGLPSNIEQTAQRAAGASAISALRRVALGGRGAAGFDRERWATQLGPLLRLWDQLVASAPPAVRAAAATAATAAAAAQAQAPASSSPSSTSAAVQSPMETFVALERSLAAAVVGAVGGALAALGRVLEGADPVTPSVLVRWHFFWLLVDPQALLCDLP